MTRGITELIGTALLCAALAGCSTSTGGTSAGAVPEHSPLDPEGTAQIEEALEDLPAVAAVEVTHQRTTGDAVQNGERERWESYSASITVTADATAQQLLALREEHEAAFDASGKADVEDTIWFRFPAGPQFLISHRDVEVSPEHVAAVIEMGAQFPSAEIRAQEDSKIGSGTTISLQGSVEVEDAAQLSASLEPLFDPLIGFSELEDVTAACAGVETATVRASVCPSARTGTVRDWTGVLTDLDALVAPHRPGRTVVTLQQDRSGGRGPDGLDLRVDGEIHDRMTAAERQELAEIAERAEVLADGDVELITG